MTEEGPMPEINDDGVDVVPRDAELSLTRRDDPLFKNVAEVNTAAKELGLTVLNARTLENLRVMGAAVDNLGAVYVGLGRVMASQEYLAKLIDRSVGIAMQELPDIFDSEGRCIKSGTQSTLDAISICNDLIRTNLESAHLLRKMTEAKVLRNPGEKKKGNTWKVGEQVKIENLQINAPPQS
ncbi:MAG TPA: hypothetical protein VD994_09590 [Prosthecobacter sp.]|nr:hypothetical protein [Prosthecobacter sp.]